MNKNEKHNLKIDEAEQVKQKIEITSALMVTQVTLLVELIVFVIFSYFVPEVWIISQIVLTLLAFVLAYNNHKLYKRSAFTYIYLALGILVLLSIFF